MKKMVEKSLPQPEPNDSKTAGKTQVKKMSPVGTEQKVEIEGSLETAKIHVLGDFKHADPKKAFDAYRELEKEYKSLLDTDPDVRLESVRRLGALISSMDPRIFGISKVIDGSATHMLASCIKDPDRRVRTETMSQLKNIMAKTPLTSMPHVISYNAMTMSPRWGIYFKGIKLKPPKLPSLGKLFGK